jgi:phage-related protein
MLEVDFYKASNGRCPVAGYIDSLNSKQAKKVAWVLNVVESMNQVPTDYLKKLKSTDDIWEVRIQFAFNIFRLLGFVENERLIFNKWIHQKNSKDTQTRDRKS